MRPNFDAQYQIKPKHYNIFMAAFWKAQLFKSEVTLIVK